MKLNKVLALALSGVMAVSMLAGCSGNSGNGGQEGEGEQTPATIQVAADLNKAISEDTQKKVTFTDDGALQEDLATAVTLNGIVTLHTAIKVQGTLQNVTGIDDEYGKMEANTVNKSYKAVQVWMAPKNANLKSAVNAFAGTVDTWFSKLETMNMTEKAFNKLAEGAPYVEYDYTATVAAVEAPTADGTASAYYFAVVITQNPTVVTKTAD